MGVKLNNSILKRNGEKKKKSLIHTNDMPTPGLVRDAALQFKKRPQRMSSNNLLTD